MTNSETATQAPGLPAGSYAPGTVVQISAYDNATRRKNLFSQTDINAELDTGSVRHILLAGLELGRQTTDNRRFKGFFPTAQAAIGVQTSFVPVAQPNIRRPDLLWRQTASSGDNYSVAKIVGVYAQAQIGFAPWLQAIVGLRYDHLNVELTNRNPLLAAGAQRFFETTDDLWSLRVRLIVKPNKIASIYAAYSRTYQPRAGVQLAGINLANAVLKPEKFDNCEIGVKWDALPTLILTAAVYELKRTQRHRARSKQRIRGAAGPAAAAGPARRVPAPRPADRAAADRADGAVAPDDPCRADTTARSVTATATGDPREGTGTPRPAGPAARGRPRSRRDGALRAAAAQSDRRAARARTGRRGAGAAPGHRRAGRVDRGEPQRRLAAARRCRAVGGAALVLVADARGRSAPSRYGDWWRFRSCCADFRRSDDQAVGRHRIANDPVGNRHAGRIGQPIPQPSRVGASPGRGVARTRRLITIRPTRCA